MELNQYINIKLYIKFNSNNYIMKRLYLLTLCCKITNKISVATKYYMYLPKIKMAVIILLLYS